MKKLGQYFLINKERVKIILDALQLRRGDFLIEIGPGKGELTKELAGRRLGLKGEEESRKVEKLKNITPTTRMYANNANKNEGWGRKEDRARKREEGLNCSIAELLKRNKESGSEIEIAAIEKDEALADALGKEMGDEVEIVCGDALKVLPEMSADFALTGTDYKVVGNIPYYITGRLFRVLGDLPWKPEVVVLMIQKEAAERVCAKPPKMNILAACVQLWAEPAIIGFVPREDFSPKPKVDGGIIKLKVKSCKPEKKKGGGELLNCSIAKLLNEEKERNYYSLVRALFKQPRKTILNNFQFSIPQSSGSLVFNFQKSGRIEKLKSEREKARKILENAGIKPEDRPQNLSVEDILRLQGKIF